MTAYGFDDDGERVHDCCDCCGSGSCPGSGSRGEDACTYRPADCACGVVPCRRWRLLLNSCPGAVGSDPDPTASTNPERPSSWRGGPTGGAPEPAWWSCNACDVDQGGFTRWSKDHDAWFCSPCWHRIVGGTS